MRPGGIGCTATPLATLGLVNSHQRRPRGASRLRLAHFAAPFQLSQHKNFLQCFLSFVFFSKHFITACVEVELERKQVLVPLGFDKAKRAIVGKLILSILSCSLNFP